MKTSAIKPHYDIEAPLLPGAEKPSDSLERVQQTCCLIQGAAKVLFSGMVTWAVTCAVLRAIGLSPGVYLAFSISAGCGGSYLALKYWIK